MPSKKPRIQALIEEEYFSKLNIICEREDRTISNITNKLIKKYVQEYEKQHGVIELEKKEDKSAVAKKALAAAASPIRKSVRR